jgi:hypothetical protein
MKRYLVCLLFSQALSAQNVYVIGPDSKGEDIIYPTQSKILEAALTKARFEYFKVANSVLDKNRDLSSWELSQFTLGLGVEGEAGIGPWNLGLAVKQRLVFKRN